VNVRGDGVHRPEIASCSPSKSSEVFMRRSVHGVTKPRTHLISAGLMIAAASVSVFSACNSNPVEFLSSSGSIQKTLPRSASSQQKMDILWVVDNSGSMCQEQKFLGENFDKFINGLSQTQLDFHLAVTTTHVPAGPYPTEPVAKAGQIQSQPQPLPTFDPTCRGTAETNYQPVRDALAAAVACMATPDSSLTAWTNDQIGCALRDQRMPCPGVTDRDGDTFITTADLFPQPSEYRPIPRFLKTEDYRDAGGQLDLDRLNADFVCMTLVGTRGTGYEKGLQAAILAVSPDLTGAGRPNEGFIRREADTAVIFVTDENDCSNDGSIRESGGICSAEACDYFNSPALADESPLLKPAEFKQRFMAALSQTKDRAVDEREVLMAGILASWKPFEGDSFPNCNTLDKPEVPIACSSPSLGEATSGDRYQRALRQFVNYFPNDRSQGDRLNFDLKDTGWMCQGDFSPAIQAIGQLAGRNAAACRPRVVPCPPR
jgi:hypothetical protein